MKSTKNLNISRREFLRTAASAVAVSAGMSGCAQKRKFASKKAFKKKPNVIFIMADDIGYSDLQCYGQEFFPTPYTTKLAEQGIRFTDAYSNAAVCSPTRYSVLTGNCPFRRYHTSHVLFNGEPLVIGENDYTVAKMMKSQGYATGVVGKWHLGLGDCLPRDINNPGRGPNDIGFDKSYIVADGHNMKPGYYIEDGEIEGGTEPPFESRLQILDRLGYKLVQHAPKDRWEDRRPDELIGARLVKKAEEFIQQNADRPFFLYFPTCSIHFPITPDPRFKGKSGLGVHGDYVIEFDWTVGRIMKKLDELGLSENTLLIVTSDNGGYPSSSSYGSCTENYRPAAPWRGHKGTAYEGGLRVPFIARMPNIAPKNAISNEPIMLSDLPATLAALTGVRLEADEALDSFNILPALMGKRADQPIRPYIVGGNRGLHPIAIRQGGWKLILNPFNDNMELYNLMQDPFEQNDLADKMPQKKFAMRSLIEGYFTSGSSRQGAKGERKTLARILQEKEHRNKIVLDLANKDIDSTQNGEPLKTEPAGKIEIDEAAVMAFEPGAVIFSDRNYRLIDIPDELEDFSFLQVPMDGIKTAKVLSDGMVYFLTPQPQRNNDSQTKKLQEQGFDKVKLQEFNLFADRESNLCTLYQKNCKEGELISFGKWAVPLVLIDE